MGRFSSRYDLVYNIVSIFGVSKEVIKFLDPKMNETFWKAIKLSVAEYNSHINLVQLL
jgi:hypothetical protein